MALLTPQTPTIAGVQLSYVAATVTTGDTLAPDTAGFLLVRNGGGAPTTVTITDPGSTAAGEANPDPTTLVTNGFDAAIGPFFPALGAAADGLVTVVCSPVTSVTLAYITL